MTQSYYILRRQGRFALVEFVGGGFGLLQGRHLCRLRGNRDHAELSFLHAADE